MIKGHILYDLNALKFVEACFIAQHDLYWGTFHSHLRRIYILLLLGGIFIRYYFLTPTQLTPPVPLCYYCQIYYISISDTPNNTIIFIVFYECFLKRLFLEQL